MRSQAGPGAGTALSMVPTICLTHSCGASACLYLLLCFVAGVAAQSIRLDTTVLRAQGLECQAEGGFALESAAARTCREAGGRVGTNCVRDLPVLATDSRSWEVVVDGLPLFGCCQCRHHFGVCDALRWHPS